MTRSWKVISTEMQSRDLPGLYTPALTFKHPIFQPA